MSIFDTYEYALPLEGPLEEWEKSTEIRIDFLSKLLCGIEGSKHFNRWFCIKFNKVEFTEEVGNSVNKEGILIPVTTRIFDHIPDYLVFTDMVQNRMEIVTKGFAPNQQDIDKGMPVTEISDCPKLSDLTIPATMFGVRFVGVNEFDNIKIVFDSRRLRTEYSCVKEDKKFYFNVEIRNSKNAESAVNNITIDCGTDSCEYTFVDCDICEDFINLVEGKKTELVEKKYSQFLDLIRNNEKRLNIVYGNHNLRMWSESGNIQYSSFDE